MFHKIKNKREKIKEDKDLYERSYFLDMKSSEKTYKKQKKKEQKKKDYITGQIINISIIIGIVFIILIFLVFFYKSDVIDFLEEIKRTFTYGMMIILGMITVLSICFNIIVKEKKRLSNLLKIVLFFNIAFLIMFFYMEIVLDNTYNNEENFGILYDTKIENKEDTKYVDVWKTFLEQELKTKTEREIFIEENMTQFTYFKIRVYFIFILYVVTMMANTYMISKIDKEIKSREILNRDDKILFKNK